MSDKMVLKYFISFLFTHNLLLSCTSAAVHMHSMDSQERELDGRYRSRDTDHYGEDGEHSFEFDHEAILGSVKEAAEYDKLSPEEAKRRLALLLPKIDLDGDKNIDRLELKNWILNSFVKLSKEEAQDRMADADDNHDGSVTWTEYLVDAFGVDTEDDVNPDDETEHGSMLKEEKAMWAACDFNGDGKLDFKEFEVFTNPEEYPILHPFLLKQTLREKDANNDGKVDFKEYVGDRGLQQDKSWLISEKQKFDHDLDLNEDGILDADEIHQWIIPKNEEIALDEVRHLFAAADDDHNNLLSFPEILEHHDAFVGSEVTDYGSDLMKDHFEDEL